MEGHSADGGEFAGLFYRVGVDGLHEVGGEVLIAVIGMDPELVGVNDVVDDRAVAARDDVFIIVFDEEGEGVGFAESGGFFVNFLG